jgi:cation transport regulator ChaB
MSDDQILLVMKGMSVLNTPFDDRKDRRDRRERLTAKKEMDAQKASYCMVRNQREYTSKSNWGYCK